MKKLWVLCSFVAMLFFCTSAGAVSFTVSHHTSEAGAISALQAWLAGSEFKILESFESYSPHLPLLLDYDATARGEGSYDTDVGEFKAGGAAGQGHMSFDYKDPKIGVMGRNAVAGNNYGRTKNWGNPSSFGDKYLDSGDVTEIVLNSFLVDLELTSLFFFMFDVADQGGTMTVTAGNSTGTHDIPEDPDRLWDGAITFVGLLADNGQFISEINWEMDVTTDGYGLDNFGTKTAPVPEPATMLLLGAGLLGLAGFRKRFLK